MLRSLLASLVILLAVPACAGTRLGGGFHDGGFRGGLPAFHRSGRARGPFSCGYNCGLGFDSESYDYGDGYGYGYDNANRYGHSNGYANGYLGGAGNALAAATA